MKKFLIVSFLMISVLSFSQAKKKAPQTFKFSTELTKLPPNFEGVNHIKLYDEIFKHFEGISKSEYETSEQYSNRLIERFGKYQDKLVYFTTRTIPQSYLKYDADSSRIIVDVPELLDLMYSGDDVTEDNLLLSMDYKESKDVRKSKYYNRSVTVTSTIIKNYYVSNDVLLDSLKSNGMIFNDITIPQAKLLKQNCRVLIVGTMKSPFVGFGSNSTEATMSEPFERLTSEKSFLLNNKEIWFYDYPTGKIYKKFIKKVN